jgi:hypothetical protein
MAFTNGMVVIGLISFYKISFWLSTFSTLILATPLIFRNIPPGFGVRTEIQGHADDDPQSHWPMILTILPVQSLSPFL